MKKWRALLIGVENDIKLLLKDILSELDVTEIPLDLRQLRDLSSDTGWCFLLSKAPSEKDPFQAEELSQVIRSRFGEVPNYLYFKGREGFQKSLLDNNGFTQVFLLPSDTFHFRSCLSEVVSAASEGAIRFYRAVKLIDIDAGQTLQFDTSLHLPVNQKFIKLSNAGEPLDDERIRKIKDHHFNTVQVTLGQLNKFYEYTAQRLREIPKSSMSVTEKKEKLSQSVRELMMTLFDEKVTSFETGQEVLKDCNAIVKNYILLDTTSDWYLRIEQVLGQNGDDYSHAGNTSTLAALFSIGLAIGSPEELAMAGLLHDIGIAELPYQVQNTPLEKMTPEELTEYRRHPELAVNLIKARKLSVPESVMKIILQHHELYNGDGYPRGLFGDRITKEAQILAIADRFDELTNKIGNPEPRVTPSQAVHQIMDEQLRNPAKIKYDPELLKGILSLFPPPAEGQ